MKNNVIDMLKNKIYSLTFFVPKKDPYTDTLIWLGGLTIAASSISHLMGIYINDSYTKSEKKLMGIQESTEMLLNICSLITINHLIKSRLDKLADKGTWTTENIRYVIGEDNPAITGEEDKTVATYLESGLKEKDIKKSLIKGSLMDITNDSLKEEDIVNALKPVEDLKEENVVKALSSVENLTEEDIVKAFSKVKDIKKEDLIKELESYKSNLKVHGTLVSSMLAVFAIAIIKNFVPKMISWGSKILDSYRETHNKNNKTDNNINKPNLQNIPNLNVQPRAAITPLNYSHYRTGGTNMRI